jgi:hypothetical protein
MQAHAKTTRRRKLRRGSQPVQTQFVRRGTCSLRDALPGSVARSRRRLVRPHALLELSHALLEGTHPLRVHVGAPAVQVDLLEAWRVSVSDRWCAGRLAHALIGRNFELAQPCHDLRPHWSGDVPRGRLAREANHAASPYTFCLRSRAQASSHTRFTIHDSLWGSRLASSSGFAPCKRRGATHLKCRQDRDVPSKPSDARKRERAPDGGQLHVSVAGSLPSDP